jgi:hypothetical protein
LYAREIPFDFAAEVVEVADFIAATTIIAAWVFMHRAATDVLTEHWRGITTAATWNVADSGIIRAACAVVIPARVAAEGINRAHRFAAGEIVAVGAFMRMAATARARISAGKAETLSPIHAGTIPCGCATTWINRADGIATFSIATVWILMHNHA